MSKKKTVKEQLKCKHEWDYNGSYERTCKVCGDEQIYHTDSCCGEGWGH